MAVIKRRPCPRTGDFIKKEEKISQEIPRKRGSFIAQLEQEQEKNKLEKEVDDNMSNENIQEEITPLDNQKQNKEEIRIDNIQEPNKNYDLESFQPVTSKTTSRSNLIAGVMSVINSKSGKRVMLSKDLMDKLNNPNKVAMSFSEESIAIGITLPNNNNQLDIKVSGKKGVIYSAGIVSEITDKYGLDFSNRTSMTFLEVEYIEDDGCSIAIIKVR